MHLDLTKGAMPHGRAEGPAVQTRKVRVQQRLTQPEHDEGVKARADRLGRWRHERTAVVLWAREH